MKQYQIYNSNGKAVTGTINADYFVCIFDFRENMGRKWKELKKQGFTCQPINAN